MLPDELEAHILELVRQRRGPVALRVQAGLRRDGAGPTRERAAQFRAPRGDGQRDLVGLRLPEVGAEGGLALPGADFGKGLSECLRSTPSEQPKELRRLAPSAQAMTESAAAKNATSRTSAASERGANLAARGPGTTG